MTERPAQGDGEVYPEGEAPTDAPIPGYRPAAGGRVLVLDADPVVRALAARLATYAGHRADAAATAPEAIGFLAERHYDAALVDLDLATPGGAEGLAFLDHALAFDEDLPVVLMAANPQLATAIQALARGAFHYVRKPLDRGELTGVVDRAVRKSRINRVKREALRITGLDEDDQRADDVLGARFDRALRDLWIAYQPVVDAASGEVFGYEALLRHDDPALPNPRAVLRAAEKLRRMGELGRVVRQRASEPLHLRPDLGSLFLNVHPGDLSDATLTSPDSALAPMARRVVLEITERAALRGVHDLPRRLAVLREIGYRIAIDDLGSGFAGLSSFAALAPDVVKLDMALVRDVEQSRTKQQLIGTMASMCRGMGMTVIAEGVETVAERDAVVDLGCDMVQGYYFARPGRGFATVTW